MGLASGTYKVPIPAGMSIEEPTIRGRYPRCIFSAIVGVVVVIISGSTSENESSVGFRICAAPWHSEGDTISLKYTQNLCN